jgi:hypothetical protein
VLGESGAEKSVNPPVTPEPDRTYQRVLDYAAWSREIRDFDNELPRDYAGVMEELVEAFDLAADKVCDLKSERSHLYNIMITDNDVAEKIPYFALGREQLLFLARLAQTLVEAWEVVEWGDKHEGKESLHPSQPLEKSARR